MIILMFRTEVSTAGYKLARQCCALCYTLLPSSLVWHLACVLPVNLNCTKRPNIRWNK